MTKEERIEHLKLCIRLFECVDTGIPMTIIGMSRNRECERELIESYVQAKRKYEECKKELKMLEEDSAE